MNEIDYVLEYYKVKKQLQVQQLRTSSKLKKMQSEIDRLKTYLKNPIVKQDNQMMKILDIVSDVTLVIKHDVLSRNREFEIASARHLFCYIAYMHHRYSLKKIGLFLSRDHSTVINSVKQFHNALDCGYKTEHAQYRKVLELLSISDADRCISRNNLFTRK